MTTDILLALALAASLVLNAMQASKAHEWRQKIRHLASLNDILIGENPETDDVHTFSPTDRGQTEQEHDDWLRTHPGVVPKPGYERKSR